MPSSALHVVAFGVALALRNARPSRADQATRKIVPQFSNEILALDKKLVRVYGFMMPLDMTDQKKHFLLSAVPPSCPFCMPAGPEALVEVMSKRPVKYAFEPIIMMGKLSSLSNDQSRMLYRMSDAELVDTQLK